jgi:DNA-binding response OmpR family regulator
VSSLLYHDHKFFSSGVQFSGCNAEKCCAFKSGKPVELGAKEYKLLLYFMEKPERVFTRKQLYSAVWEDEYYYDDNTIMVHISRLRNKIEDDPQNPGYLKTVRGIGYKLHYIGENNEK